MTSGTYAGSSHNCRGERQSISIYCTSTHNLHYRAWYGRYEDKNGQKGMLCYDLFC